MHNEEEQLSVLSAVLGGKSKFTLLKRACSLGKLIRWWQRSGHVMQLFPFRGEVVESYMLEERDAGALFSRLQGVSEAISFGIHVLGIEWTSPVLTPVVKGILRGAKKGRNARIQSRTLKASEILTLEGLLHDCDQDMIDRLFAGYVLFLLYARARVSDTRDISGVLLDVNAERLAGKVNTTVGYLEVTTHSHKTAMWSNGMSLPLVAPLLGLGAKPWGLEYADLRERAGLKVGSDVRGPLQPAPTSDGGWMERALSTDEVTNWLNAALGTRDAQGPGRLTSHGLKSTLLKWCSQYGLSEEVRAVLGHHISRGSTAVAAYARDRQSAPLRSLETVLESVRRGLFLPDLTRSGLFAEEPGHGAADEAMKGGETLGSEVGHAVESEDILENQHDECSGTPDESTSDSSSSSGSSIDSSDSDAADLAITESAEKGTILSSFNWRDLCDVFQHKKTKTLHLLPKGEASAFVCGRKLSAGHEKFVKLIYSDGWKCSQCERGRPVRTLENLADALNPSRSSKRG